MNIKRNCLLILVMCLSTGISNVSLADITSDKQATKLKPYSPGRWVASDKFIKKNTVCYREYVCRLNKSSRFGRNLKKQGTKLQRGKKICSSAGRFCQCKTTAPTLRCDIKFLKRR